VCDRSEVLDAVVFPIAIDVVNLELGWDFTLEGFIDQAVNIEALPLSIVIM
jgi:hypothetical protein